MRLWSLSQTFFCHGIALGELAHAIQSEEEEDKVNRRTSEKRVEASHLQLMIILSNKKLTPVSHDLQGLFSGERGSQTYGFIEYHKIHKQQNINYL